MDMDSTGGSRVPSTLEILSKVESMEKAVGKKKRQTQIAISTRENILMIKNMDRDISNGNLETITLELMLTI